MKILIVGGGIGGLAAAGFLEQRGFEVTLVERAPEFKHIGFTMSVFDNGRRMLHSLGIESEVAKKGYLPPWAELADTNGHILGHKLKVRDIMIHGGERVIGIERATLHEQLVKKLEKTNVVLGTTIKEFENHSDRVHVTYDDGRKETYDLLIAADGINSKIREEVFGPGSVGYYGWSLRFFWLPPHIPAPKGALCLTKDKIVLCFYPTLNRCSVALYEYNPSRENHPPIILQPFLPYLKKHGWTDEQIEDLHKESVQGTQFYSHLQHVSLGKWYKKRVVLLGDSRHGMSPISGMSGSMAMEDGFVLAEELSKVSDENIFLALENYERRRMLRVQKVIRLSSFLELFYFARSPLERMVKNFIMRLLPSRLVAHKYQKVIYEPL